MYTTTDFKTKKELKAAVAAPDFDVTLFAPFLGEPVHNGRETVEGPQYPKPHRWYARVEVVNGIVTKVLQ